MTAQENTERVLRGVLDSGGFLADSQAVANGLSSLGGSSECPVTSSTVCPVDDATCTPAVVEGCVSTPSVTAADLADARAEMHEGLDDLLRVLREELFIEANLESETETTAVYRLPASMLCGSTETDSVTQADPAGDLVAPAPEPAPAEECESYTELQPRLRLSSPAEGDIDVELLLTASKHNPVSLQLYSDRLGVVVDLAEVKSSVEAAGEDLGALETLAGQVQLQLVRNAELDYSATLGFLSELHVKVNDGDDGDIEVLLAATAPAVEVRLDGAARTITGSYDWGALNVLAPLASFMGSSDSSDDVAAAPIGTNGDALPAPTPTPARVYTGMIDAVLGGLNGSLTFDGNADLLHFEGLGLGDVPTTIQHEGNTLLQLDVNPDAGRRFDMTVTSAGESNATVTFSPTLDLHLLLNFAHIADQAPDLQTFLLNDQLRLWFEGVNPSISATDGQLRVESGTLHIDSSSGTVNSLTVGAGMCLQEAEQAEEPASLADAFEAAACQ